MSNETHNQVITEAMTADTQEALHRQALDYCNAKYNCRAQQARFRIQAALALDLDQYPDVVY